MKTKNEVHELKKNWLTDRTNYFIEKTPGFHDYYEELKAFRLNQEFVEWKRDMKEKREQRELSE